MKQKQRIFIYDRKEMGVLLLLGLTVAVFAFTLGVHLGKRVGPKGLVGAADPTIAGAVQDKLPDSKELAEQGKNAEQTAEDSMNQALHDEVARTGLKMDTPRQIELPNQPKTHNAGATTLNAETATTAETKAESPRTEEPEKKADNKQSPASSGGSGRFTLQIGSYPALVEAQGRLGSLKAEGLKAFLKEAEVKGKGKWYRVFIGEFSTKADAEKAGQGYRARHVIDEFVVAKVAGG